MPLYSFATYADYREEWAIEAKDLEEARRKLGDDPDGSWLDGAIGLEFGCVGRRDEFVTEEDDETPAIDEITPDHWGYRAAHREYIERSLRQNIAAIAGDFHAHRFYWTFYETFGRQIDGFVGNYEICIAMAQALTDWEVANGLGQAYENAGVTWIEVVENFVDDVLTHATNTGQLPHFASIISGLSALQRRAA